MAIRLEDAELAALTGQRPELWQLYIVLRTLMDYHTGLVGATRRISWRSLQEALYVEPGQGLQRRGWRAGSGENPAGATFKRVRETRQPSGIRYPERKRCANAHVARRAMFAARRRCIGPGPWVRR